MRARILPAVAGLIAITAAAAQARPGELPRPTRYLDPEPEPTAAAGVLDAAGAVTYFGGTFWNPDSSRWEAIRDSAWTFDTGVGSHFDHGDPAVNPFKDPSLHASMEGWVGIDLGFRTIGEFRRLAASQFPGAVCVGAVAGLGGAYSLWAGQLPGEAAQLCYAAGQGYGNSWNLAREKSYAYPGAGDVVLEYDYALETEPGFDYVYVEVDTGNGAFVAVQGYSGTASGHAALTLTAGADLPAQPAIIVVRFRVLADGSYSDEDGLWATACGAFAVDNVQVSGAVSEGPDTFEFSEDGWSLSEPIPGPGGDWSDIVHLDDLPPLLTACACAVADSVLVFEDPGVHGHNLWQDNIAGSPWIDLKAAGLDGSPRKVIEAHIYAELPLLNYVFAQVQAQWYPDHCEISGMDLVSPWTSSGFVFYFGGVPFCSGPDRPPSAYATAQGGDGRAQFDFSTVIPVGAEQVRIALGVVSFCRFFANCTSVTNPTPYFDDVRFGVSGSPHAPFLEVADAADGPQDAFPVNPLLGLAHPARIDGNRIKGDTDQEPGTVLGDTLVVSGGSDGAEVWVQFAVDPGPMIDAGALGAWLAGHAYQGTWRGLAWYAARMDTAQTGAVLHVNRWMTTYHEEDPNFSGTDRDLDAGDPTPGGAVTRLANDIFPDDLLTPGSRLCLFYKTRYTGSGLPYTGVWFTEPDTAGGAVLEMEVMPSSASADGTWNCVLYVDRQDREAQGTIEAALASVLPGGSDNFENTAWDRFDVRDPFTHGNGSVGRGAGTGYGATVEHLLGYRSIVWSTGEEANYGLVEADAQVLMPWLELGNPEGLTPRGLFLTGNALARSMSDGQYPSAGTLLNDYAGATYDCYVIRNANCPGTPAAIDETACMPLDPVGGHFAGNDGDVVEEGNGCPQRRNFSLIGISPTALGTALGNETWDSPVKGPLEFHSVSHEGPGGDYRVVTDGGSVHYRGRNADCTDRTAVADRLARVLGWFAGGPPGDCGMPGAVTAVPGGEPAARTALLGARPHPMASGRGGAITFALDGRRRARVEVFSVGGRLVRTLVDDVLDPGRHAIAWDGRDDAGRALPAGVYFYRLVADGFAAGRKLVVVPGR